jgi:hypothetical protein
MGFSCKTIKLKQCNLEYISQSSSLLDLSLKTIPVQGGLLGLLLLSVVVVNAIKNLGGKSNKIKLDLYERVRL